MAEKSFGVKEVNLIGASGTPTITSPNNLNLSAVNVAISTNATIGGTLSVTGNVSVGGTLTYEDVTNIDSVGIITARDGIDCNGDLDVDGHTNLDNVSVAGVSTFSGSINATGGLVGNATKITLNSSTTNSSLPVLFSTGVTGSSGADTLINSSKLTFNPSSGTLSATIFSGSGASLTNLPVADSDIQVAYTVTANGTSAYRFAGNGVVSTEDDPDLYLIRGQKYRFINNSGGSHPFQIREESGGTAYSTGVTNNGAASGNIDFAPTYDSPAQLVYQCTSHGGMVGNIYLRDAAGNNTNVGVTTFADNVSIIKSSGPILELCNNTNSTTMALRLHEGVAGSTANGGGIIYDGSGNKLHITCGTNLTTERITILRDNGKVGINSTNPSSPLEIYTAASAAWKFRIDTTVSDGAGFYQRANGDFEMVLRDASNNNNYIVGTGGDLQFASSGSERFRIDSNGDVEIMQAKNLTWVYAGGSTHRARIRALSNDELIFENGSGNTERLRITGDGVFHLNSSDSASGGRIYANSSSLYLQSGNGRQTIRVSDAAAGVNRTIEMTSAGNLKFPAGASIGIDFSAKSNLGGATDTTLAHYEEGTWTPNMTNLDVPGHVTTNYATYTRVGRIVTISAKFTISSSINDGSGFGFELPFGPISDRQIVIPAISDRSGSNKAPFAFNNVNSDHKVYAKALEGYAFQTYNMFSGNYIIVTGSYETDA